MESLIGLTDSMPIIMAQRGRRFHAKVAPEIATKNGYCATTRLWPFLSSRVEIFKSGSCQRKQTHYHVFRLKNTWSKRVDNRDFSSFSSIFT